MLYVVVDFGVVYCAVYCTVFRLDGTVDFGVVHCVVFCDGGYCIALYLDGTVGLDEVYRSAIVV